jgi:hypothetical protein
MLTFPIVVLWSAVEWDKNCIPLGARPACMAMPRSVRSKFVNSLSRREVERMMMTLNVIPAA